MKHFLFFICILCSGLFYSCKDGLWMDIVYVWTLKNNTDYKISVYSIFDLEPVCYDSVKFYPDTTLPHQYPNNIVNINPFKNKPIAESGCTFEELYRSLEIDTVSFFVFSTDTLTKLGWDSVRRTYNIIQRYDIGRKDIKSILGKMAFPPTEEMRNIKMWPPYGTYDPLGHRRE